MAWRIDPVTVKFLENAMDPIFFFFSFIRFSWGTASRMLSEKRAVKVVWKNEVKEDPPLKRFEYESSMQRTLGITKSDFLWIVFMIQIEALRL